MGQGWTDGLFPVTSLPHQEGKPWKAGGTVLEKGRVRDGIRNGGPMQASIQGQSQ